MPVGREKPLSPERHSGQRKLHDVVGSMLRTMGMTPANILRFLNPSTSLNIFIMRLQLSTRRRLHLS